MIRVLFIPLLVLAILFSCDRCHGAGRRQVRGEEIEVVWNPNPIGENVLYYVVSWAREGQQFGIANQSKQAVLPECTIAGLAVGEVRIAVRAVNAYGSSAWSDPVTTTIRGVSAMPANPGDGSIPLLPPAGSPGVTFVSPK